MFLAAWRCLKLGILKSFNMSGAAMGGGGGGEKNNFKYISRISCALICVA